MGGALIMEELKISDFCTSKKFPHSNVFPIPLKMAALKKKIVASIDMSAFQLKSDLI